jgi:hypothetical protein
VALVTVTIEKNRIENREEEEEEDEGKTKKRKRKRTMVNVVNALMLTRLLTRNELAGHDGISFGSVWWFIYAGISFFLVIFAGIMSGLTLGLMSLGLVDLEILQRSGSPSEKKQAGLLFFDSFSSSSSL